ncbi:MAG TPA: hypothetical protein VGF55_11195 [Gemmataceae bacterium]
MTISELFALPVGQSLWWGLHGVGGEVILRDADGLYIAWVDGQFSVVNPGDDGLAAFAAELETAPDPRPILNNGHD